MPRRYLCSLVLGFVVACGGDGGGPSGSSGPTSVSVTYPAGGTIFIGDAVQFQARLTSSDGTARDVSSEATWGSDAPAVATVSSTGLVSALAAGEATIFADVNPRGTRLTRVFPNFGGRWEGNDVLASCEASGALAPVCEDPGLAVGEVFTHRSMFTQNEASVDAVITTGPDSTASMTGNITVAGELQLPSAPVLPPDPMINTQLQNWRSRADTPSRMTGTYELFLTAPGVTGAVTVSVRLQDVVKASGSSVSVSSTALHQVIRRISTRVEALR